MARPWGLVVHGGSTDRPAFVNGGDDLEVKLKDYLDGATVLFDAAGNVVDGRLQSDDSSPWIISPRGVEVSFTRSDLSNSSLA